MTEEITEKVTREYPAEYDEYMKVLEDKKDKDNPVNNVSEASKNCPTNIVEKNKMSEMLKKAIKSATQYNLELNQARKEERRVSLDLQTDTVHYPIGLGKDNKMLKKNVATGKCLKVGKYPVATIHGQHQDWYIKYSAEELKYFPINTVLYGPIASDAKKLIKPKDGQEGEKSSGSDSDSNSDSDSSSSCSQEDNNLERSNRENGHNGNDPNNEDGNSCDSCSSSQSSSSEEDVKTKTPSTSNDNSNSVRGSFQTVCKICKGSVQGNRSNVPEEFVHCSDCANSVHPSCLQLTTDMVDVIKSYAWQCTDCKTCVHCNKPHNEDKLMFCDMCDRGYHTFCVGLRVIPTGKWVCKLCAQCAQCGAIKPGDGPKTNWHHETIKIKSPDGETLRRHQLLCSNCYKQRKMR